MKNRLLSVSLLAALLFTGCSKDDDDTTTTPTNTTKTYKLGTFYQLSSDDMVIQINGTDAYVTYLASDNPYATNSSVFKVGDPYIKNFRLVSGKDWTGDVAVGKFTTTSGSYKKTLSSVEYQTRKIYHITDDAESLFIDGGLDYDLGGYMEKVDGPQGTHGSGGGGNNGGGSGGSCIEGTWYSPACGDAHGVVWIFNADGSGSFSNKDCNGICTPFKLKFTYEITGNSCQVIYLPKEQQEEISCTGYAPKRPDVPVKTEPFTFSCTGSELTVTSGNGTNTFTR